MRICMIATTLPPVVGGLETHVWELSRALVAAGHTVDLIGYRNYGGEVFRPCEERGNLRVHREWERVLPVYYLRYRLFCIRAALRAWRIHREQPFDLVHAHQVYPAGVAGALVCSILRIPLVITCHGTALFVNWEVGWLRPLLKWALSRASLTIGVGRELRDKLVACGVPPSRVAVVPNCVDTRQFAPGRDGGQVRLRYGWTPGDTVIAYTGRLHPVKGPQYFVRMAEELLRRDPGLKFLIVGSGELEEGLRKEVGRSGRGKALVFAGEIAHDAMPDHVGAADIVVIPSLAEGGGLTCLEAMAMGKAIVANRVGGMADLVEAGRTGLLVALDSSRSVHYDYGLDDRYLESLAASVERLVGDVSLRRRLGEAARREVERNFGWDAGMKRLLPLYERALKSV